MQLSNFLHKIGFSCYLQYTLRSEIEQFAQRYMFLATTLMEHLAMMSIYFISHFKNLLYVYTILTPIEAGYCVRIVKNQN